MEERREARLEKDAEFLGVANQVALSILTVVLGPATGDIVVNTLQVGLTPFQETD